MDKLEILHQFPFFQSGSTAFKKEILAAGQLVRLEVGTRYVCEGQHCKVIAFVGDGRLRVFKLAESGREITLYQVEAGETCLLNVSCLLSGTSCPATAYAEQPVTAVAVDGDVFRRWMDTQPPLRAYVFEMLATRLADVMALVEEVAFRKMDQRLVEYLGKRFFANGMPLVELTVTHERIAQELGSAREVVSRLLKDLERAQAVKLARGRILLHNEQVLRQMMTEK